MSILKTYEAAAFCLTHMLLSHAFLLPTLKQATNTDWHIASKRLFAAFVRLLFNRII